MNMLMSWENKVETSPLSSQFFFTIVYSFSRYNNIHRSKHANYSSADLCIADMVHKDRHSYGFVYIPFVKDYVTCN